MIIYDYLLFIILIKQYNLYTRSNGIKKYFYGILYNIPLDIIIFIYLFNCTIYLILYYIIVLPY